jgi:hypothetical protein
VSDFSAVLPGLKSLNIGFSLLSFVLLYFIGRRHYQQSFWISIAVVLWMGTHSRFVELTNELMSEPLYFLLSLGTLIVAEKMLNASPPSSPTSLRREGIPYFIALLILSVMSFYTRSMGIVLISAVFGAFLFKKQFRVALIYGVCSFLSIIPWFCWSLQQKQVTQHIGHFLVRSFEESYFQSFRFDLYESGNLLSLYAKGFQELLGYFSLHFFLPLERLIMVKETPFAVAMILSSSYLLAIILSAHLYQLLKQGQWSVYGLYTVLYLLILPFWSYYTVYPRFLLMVLPFLVFALLQAIQEALLVYKMPSFPIAFPFLKAAYPLPPGGGGRRVGGKHAGSIILYVLIGIGLIGNYWHMAPALSKNNPNQLLLNASHDLWMDYQGAAEYLKTKTSPATIIAPEFGEEAYFYALNGQRRSLDTMLFLPHDALEAQCPSKSENAILLGCLQNMMTQRAEAFYLLLKQRGVRYVIGNRYTMKKNGYNNGVLIARHDLLIPYLQSLHPGSLISVYRSPDDWIVVYKLQ